MWALRFPPVVRVARRSTPESRPVVLKAYEPLDASVLRWLDLFRISRRPFLVIVLVANASGQQDCGSLRFLLWCGALDGRFCLCMRGKQHRLAAMAAELDEVGLVAVQRLKRPRGDQSQPEGILIARGSGTRRKRVAQCSVGFGKSEIKFPSNLGLVQK